MENGKLHLIHGNLYGYDGASTNAQQKQQNEDLIGQAILRMLEVGDVPYFLSGDFNAHPDESDTIKPMIAKGLVVDIPAAFGHGEKHAYAREGPAEGLQGPGRTRIDTVLTNKAGFALVENCRMRWDLLCSDHVPIQVELKTSKFRITVKIPKLQPAFPARKSKAEKGKAEQMTEAVWNKHWSTQEEKPQRVDVRGTWKPCTDCGPDRRSMRQRS